MLSVEPSVFKNAIGIKREELLEEGIPGFVFATPTGMISSKKMIRNIDFERSENLNFLEQQKKWLEQAKQQLTDQIQETANSELIIVGSLPFDNRDLPELSIAEARNTHLADIAEVSRTTLCAENTEAKLLPQHADYVDGVRKLVEIMQKTELKKATDQQTSSKICSKEMCSAADMADFDVAQLTQKAAVRGMSVNLENCQGNSDERSCIYIAWGDTAPTNGDANGEGNCTTSTAYDPSSTCLIMEVY